MENHTIKPVLGRGKGTFINCTDYDDAIEAMELYAENRLKQYQAGLIEKLEAEAKELECKAIYGAYRRCIELIKNS